jgi:glycosyltransferase involved in cell wall biosynthesis
MPNISTVINTLNSGETLETCLKSVNNLGPIIIVDMHSIDNTLEIAKKYTDKIYMHDPVGYVEPARNFAIAKAESDWVLVLDSDEELTPSLADTLIKIADESYDEAPKNCTHYFIPRKTIIFGQWMEHSGWWPDEKMRFFKKGSVNWKNEIHSEPETTGEGHHFESEEKNAIIHHHYNTVSDWIQRMDKYSTIQAVEKMKSGYVFEWKDLLRKPLSEFLRRFFVWEGWKDGVIALGICLMQALSEAIVYMKVREGQMKTQKLYDGKDAQFIQDFGEELDKNQEEFGFYLEKLGLQSQLKRWLQKVLP